jgi:hypothetical protein
MEINKKIRKTKKKSKNVKKYIYSLQDWTKKLRCDGVDAIFNIFQ